MQRKALLKQQLLGLEQHYEQHPVSLRFKHSIHELDFQLQRSAAALPGRSLAMAVLLVGTATGVLMDLGVIVAGTHRCVGCDNIHLTPYS